MSTTITKENIQHKHYDAMVIATLPLIIASTFLFGTRVLLLAIIAVVTARAIDVLASMMFNTELDTSDKSSIVAALVFVLMLPVSIPIYIVVVTIGVTIFIGKHAFGGHGSYPFSLPALAICLAAVNWPNEVFKVVEPFSSVEFFSGEAVDFLTHTTVIKQGGLPNVTLIDLLLGNYASAMGTSFVLVIVAIGIYLVVTKRISFIIPATYLITYSLMSLLSPRIFGISLLDNLTLEVLTGGCIFYAFFVISETALTPKGKLAQGVYGFLAGALGVLFTQFGAYEIGVCFAILILNAMQRAIEEGSALALVYIGDYKKKSKQPKEVKEKPAPKPIQKPEPKVKEIVEKEKEDKSFPLDLIKKAEDDIDEVIFSTQTFSMQELLDETRKSKSKTQKEKINADGDKEGNKKPSDIDKKPQNKKPRRKKPENKTAAPKKSSARKPKEETQKETKPKTARKPKEETQKETKPRTARKPKEENIKDTIQEKGEN